MATKRKLRGNVGEFIVLDGINGAGKSTQCEILASRLTDDGYDVLQTSDPNGTFLGSNVKTLILEGYAQPNTVAATYLFLAARAQLVETVIRPALESGKVVICDRFETSTIAYQVDGEGGIAINSFVWAADMWKAAFGRIQPVTIILDCPPAVARERRMARLKAADRIETYDEPYFDRVRQSFQRQRGQGLGTLVDATLPIGDLADTISRVVRSWLADRTITVEE